MTLSVSWSCFTILSDCAKNNQSVCNVSVQGGGSQATTTSKSAWFPRVVTWLSVYGVLDCVSWRAAPVVQPPWSSISIGNGDKKKNVRPSHPNREANAAKRVKISSLEFELFCRGLAFVSDVVYKPTGYTARECYQEVGFFLGDILERTLAQQGAESPSGSTEGGSSDFVFPPSLFVCGNRDPLLLSSIRVFEQVRL